MKRSLVWKGLLLLLVLVLALGAGQTVLAADGSGSAPITVLAPDGSESDYNTLVEAAAAAPSGSTIRLNQDITMAYFQLNGKQQKPTMMVEGKSLILDGQGHTVQANSAEAFSMIEVRPTGVLTVKNIILDGGASDNRSFSNILNIEGGEVTIEDGTVLQNNCTAAVDIGVNVPGGKCTMNGGLITNNVMPAGSNNTGVAVTVLEESTFVMNGGVISNNRTEKYGSSGIMVNRGGTAILNGGTIENNTTVVRGMASAVHIQGGLVELNGTIIQNNTSADGYGAVYVTNNSSFGNTWDGILDINGGAIRGNHNADGTSNAIYLWSKEIGDTSAYVRFSGEPTIEGTSVIFANNSSSVVFHPLEVDGAFHPTVPVELDILFEYELGQTIVVYQNGTVANSNDFVAAVPNYGFQKDEENNLLYTEEKRHVIFMDGSQPLEEISYWAFVEDAIVERGCSKDGYTLVGWYQDEALTQAWNFKSDVLPRGEGEFPLYAKWEALPAEAPVLPKEETRNLPCDFEDAVTLTPDFAEDDAYTYRYVWKDEKGAEIGTEQSLTIPALENGQKQVFVLTVIAERKDNGETAQVSTRYTVSRAQHTYGESWKYDEANHWKVCSVCGGISQEAAHEFQWIVDMEAGQKPGSKHEECKICGYQKPAVEIPATQEPTNPEGGENPPAQTGEGGGIVLFGVLLLVSALGLTGMALYGKKQRR